MINLETITGFKNIDDFVNEETFSDIDGVVLGRVDMTGSMGLTREDVNCDQIFEIAQVISEKMKNAKMNIYYTN